MHFLSHEETIRQTPRSIPANTSGRSVVFQNINIMKNKGKDYFKLKEAIKTQWPNTCKVFS
jgi:hypothetical protein